MKSEIKTKTKNEDDDEDEDRNWIKNITPYSLFLYLWCSFKLKNPNSYASIMIKQKE